MTSLGGQPYNGAKRLWLDAVNRGGRVLLGIRVRVLLMSSVLVHGAALSGCAEPIGTSTNESSTAGTVLPTSASSPVKTAITAKIESTEVPLRGWKFIVLHHTATAHGSVASIDAEHKTRRDAAGQPWKGIGYHFLIGNGDGMADGAVESTFRWHEQIAGAHAGNQQYNELGIGICLVGNFEEAAPTAAQLLSVEQLLRQLQEEFGIGDRQILRHGDLKATACPGRLFPFAMIVQAQQGTQQEFSHSHLVRPMERVETVVAGRIKEGAPHVGSKQSLSIE